MMPFIEENRIVDLYVLGQMSHVHVHSAALRISLRQCGAGAVTVDYRASH